MKLNAYTITILLLFSSMSAFAGGRGREYTRLEAAAHLPLFQFDWNSEGRFGGQTEANLRDWQVYTGQKDMPLEDIRQVVYRYTYEELLLIEQGNVPDRMRSNAFAAYLTKRNDKKAIRFLLLAKKCERERFKRFDPWFYPTKEELDFQDMREIIEEALAYKGSRLKARYLLQAIRAAVTMGNHTLCRQLWHEQFKQLPPSAVRDMAEGYLAGVEYDAENWHIAMTHYGNIHQFGEEFWECVRQLNTGDTPLEKARFLLRQTPNTQWIIEEANRHLVESGSCNPKKRAAWRELAMQAIRDPRVEQPAMWWQLLAYSAYKQGDNYTSLHYIRQAGQAKGSEATHDYVRIFHIYLQALTGSYDTAFDSAITKQLKWLDGRIQANITPDVVERYTDWDMHYNWGYYYYNDVLRRIAFAVMIPNYLQKGKEAEALLLAGMVGERYRTLVGFRKNPANEDDGDSDLARSHVDYQKMLEDEEGDYKWNSDFYTDIFVMMDTLSTRGVDDYIQVLEKGGKNTFERFCAAHCYKNFSYLKEILATKYMREEAFDKAAVLLAECDTEYMPSLNIYKYFLYDPFAETLDRRKPIPSRKDYKLNFARHMNDLQQMMHIAQSPRLKAEATFRYALGMLRASCDYWALTSYAKGSESHSISHYQMWSTRLQQKAQQLAIEAFTYSTDKDFNYKWLQIFLHSGWENDSPERALGDQLWEKYRTTDFYQYRQAICDTREDWSDPKKNKH